MTGNRVYKEKDVINCICGSKMLRPWYRIRFRKLCYLLGHQDSKKYLDTLDWKYESARYHNEISQKIWNKLEGKTTILLIASGEWGRAQLISEAETISCAHILNTMVDVLLQIINRSLLKNIFHESKVTMKNIKKELKKDKYMSRILTKLIGLEQSQEYEYIRAFDNTIKHRRLLDTDYTWNFNEKEGIKKGIRFKEFEYEYKTRQGIERKKFPVLWATDITENYRRAIFDLICDIGTEMNTFFREQKKSLTSNSAYHLLQYL